MGWDDSNLPTTAAANILDGYQSFAATTGATTLITIPAGRVWVGVISASCTACEVAAGAAQARARAVFTTAGAGVTPAAGTVFAVDALAGANAATGLVGDGVANSGNTPLIVVAPAANTVTIQVATTQTGTQSQVDASAIGALQ